MGLLIRLRNGIAWLFGVLRRWRQRLNLRMQDNYKPGVLALFVCGIVVLLASVMLFVPPYLGYSNDGSYATVLQDTNLARLDEEDDDVYFNYYERQYRIVTQAYKPGTTPMAQKLLVNAAVWLDTLFTRDDIFDIRWLALLHLLLYALALYPAVCFVLERTQNFSEGLLVGILAVFIFADVGLVTRFASLYTQPLLLICIVGLVGLVFWIIRSKKSYVPLGLFLLVALVLASVNAYCGVAAILFAGLCLALCPLRRALPWRACCIVLGLLISISSVHSATVLVQQQTDDDQYHAMTRGVLLQASNPVETLAEFGIESRYSLLADTYANQIFPLAHSSESIVQQGFLDQYSTAGILVHYLRHPGSLLGMLDISMKNSFITRPDYSGNYERSANLPARAKSPFMALWSSFKSRSVPSTIAFFFLIVLVVLLLYRRGKKLLKGSNAAPGLQTAVWMAMLALSCFAVAELVLVILFSGDALMLREAFVFSVCFDLLFLFAISEILNRLDIIREKK